MHNNNLIQYLYKKVYKLILIFKYQQFQAQTLKIRKNTMINMN